MAKKILFGIIMISIGFIIFIYFSITKNQNTLIIQESALHNGKNINDILSKENYDKIGINPEKYTTFKEFLTDFKTFSGVTIDPLVENFSIGVEMKDGKIMYVPYRFLQSQDTFDSKQSKNLAILDIYEAYTKGKIYGGVNSPNSGVKVLFEDETKHPEHTELIKIFSKQVKVFEYIKNLESSKNIGQSKEELKSYLYDFVGNYENANENRQKTCKEYGSCQEILLKINGKVVDMNGKGIGGVKVENLNNRNHYTITNLDGTYNFQFKVFPFSHLRFKTQLQGYSDAFSNYSLNMYNDLAQEKSLVIDFKVQKTDSIISFYKENIDDYKKGRYYVIDHKNSKYFIPTDGLYFFDGKKYEGTEFDVYLYLFTKQANMDNLLENDTFEPVFGYVGNIMKTFGMPYIQFIDRETNQELFIKSSNPMILQNTVYHMKELYDNYDQIYEAITKEDMKFLVEETKKSDKPYPIDFDFLAQHNMLRWPARWSLDRKAGTWVSVGQRVLSEDGLVEIPFFQIKDN